MKKRPGTMRGSDAPVKKFWPSKAPRTMRGSDTPVKKRPSKAPAPEDSVPLTPWAKARLAYDDDEGPQADFDENEAVSERLRRLLIDPGDDFAPSSPGSPEGLVLIEDPELNRLIMDAAEQARLAGQGEPDRPPEGEGEGEQPPEGEGEQRGGGVTLSGTLATALISRAVLSGHARHGAHLSSSA